MADDLKVQKIMHKGKHVASIHTYRGRGGNWTSGVHHPDGSSASDKYGADLMDTKRELIKKVRAYHKGKNEEVQQIDEIKVGDFVKPNTMGGEVHRVFGREGNSLSVGKYHGPNQYGGTKTMHVTKVVKVKKPVKESSLKRFGQYVSEAHDIELKPHPNGTHYTVHKVDRARSGIHPDMLKTGEKLSDTHVDDLKDMGYKVKIHKK